MNDVIRNEIAAGRASIGTCQILPGNAVAERLGRVGFPWVLVDLQHGSCELSDLTGVLQALELAGAAALVRTKSCDPAEIMRVLDLGALGLVLPMVGSVVQARQIVEAALYPPHGLRSLGPLRKTFGGPDAGDVTPLVLAMIETNSGVEAIEGIVAIDGIDGLILGPGDMALSLGEPLTPVPGEGVMDVARRIISACKAHGKIPGSFAFNDGALKAFASIGMTLMPFGADALFMAELAQQKLAIARAVIGVPDA